MTKDSECPSEGDAFVDAYAEYVRAQDDSENAVREANAYLFDAFAASHLENYPTPDPPAGLEDLDALPIGFSSVLDADTIGRHFDEVVAVLHDRASTGSFYTPEEIVEYIDQNTIRPRVRDLLVEAVGVELPDGLADKLEPSPEELANACTEDQAREALAEVADLSICDPACGSGQFLVGAVDEVATMLAVFAMAAGEESDWPALVWEASKTVYGVDLVPQTVHMARLRIKLRVLEALPGDAPDETVAQIRRSPHLQHQIKQGNSLIGISDMDELEDALRKDDSESSGQATFAGGAWT